MKIIKEGDPKKRANVVRRFECKNCGCVFEANENEYEVEEWCLTGLDGGKIITIRTSSTCPLCGEMYVKYIHAECP